MSQMPSFIFVHGAWHISEVWSKVTSMLAAKGHICAAVRLPSTTGNAAAGIGDDVAAVQDAIKAQTEQGNDVVLVVHSYGGLVGSSSVKGFTRTHDSRSSSANVSSGHVIGLAMIATGFAITGTSFLGGGGGKPPPWWIADAETGFATIVGDARDLFYNDLSEEEGSLWVSRLTKHSLKSLAEGGEYVYAGWKDVPCWFLVTQEDHGLPAELQRLFVTTAQEAGADVTMREVAASHSPMLSQPEKTTDFILDAAAYFLEVKSRAA